MSSLDYAHLETCLVNLNNKSISRIKFTQTRKLQSIGYSDYGQLPSERVIFNLSSRVLSEAEKSLLSKRLKFAFFGRRNNNNNNKIWILCVMSVYSFDKPKFTSARGKRKERENNKQKHQKFTMHNLREQ